MRALLLGLPLVAACRAPTPGYVDMPPPYDVRGVHIELHGILRSTTRIWGVHGKITNTNAIAVKGCTLGLEALDNWGTRVGAYVVTREQGGHIGGKPRRLMDAVVRDYSKPGDLVCDPCAGYATTAIAAETYGRSFIGAEVDPETHAKAIARMESGVQMGMMF